MSTRWALAVGLCFFSLPSFGWLHLIDSKSSQDFFLCLRGPEQSEIWVVDGKKRLYRMDVLLESPVPGSPELKVDFEDLKRYLRRQLRFPSAFIDRDLSDGEIRKANQTVENLPPEEARDLEQLLKLGLPRYMELLRKLSDEKFSYRVEATYEKEPDDFQLLRSFLKLRADQWKAQLEHEQKRAQSRLALENGAEEIRRQRPNEISYFPSQGTEEPTYTPMSRTPAAWQGTQGGTHPPTPGAAWNGSPFWDTLPPGRGGGGNLRPLDRYYNPVNVIGRAFRGR